MNSYKDKLIPLYPTKKWLKENKVKTISWKELKKIEVVEKIPF